MTLQDAQKYTKHHSHDYDFADPRFVLYHVDVHRNLQEWKKREQLKNDELRRKIKFSLDVATREAEKNDHRLKQDMLELLAEKDEVN
jgi:hypothetical protein